MNLSRTSLANCGSDVAITRRCTSPECFDEIMVGRMVKPNIIAGSRMVITMNDFLRTVSRYSRRANSSALCIGFPHDVDEDGFQRRFHQLKFVYPATFRS